MASQDINKAYVSPYDKFMYEFDLTHSPSLSQQKEIQKHQRIAELRDNPDAVDSKAEIWEEF